MLLVWGTWKRQGVPGAQPLLCPPLGPLEPGHFPHRGRGPGTYCPGGVAAGRWDSALTPDAKQDSVVPRFVSGAIFYDVKRKSRCLGFVSASLSLQFRESSWEEELSSQVPAFPSVRCLPGDGPRFLHVRLKNQTQRKPTGGGVRPLTCAARLRERHTERFENNFLRDLFRDLSGRFSFRWKLGELLKIEQ